MKITNSLPRLVIQDGTLEAMKWLGVLLMTGDHVNKYLFYGTLPFFYEIGRLAMPLFVFVLAYNLARPDALNRGVYRRTLIRLSVFGTLAIPPFIALGGLVAGWWPLNILFTLLLITAILYLIERGTVASFTAAAVFFLLGGSVEFQWSALILGLSIWGYCTKPSLDLLVLCLTALALLVHVNGNLWAFLFIPIVVQASRLDLRVQRLPWFFYTYYPLHLVALYLIRIPMTNAGYLFF